MSGPKVNHNPRKLKHGANVSRPNGCSIVATSSDERELLAAILTGNRATRRQAMRTAKRQQRQATKTAVNAGKPAKSKGRRK